MNPANSAKSILPWWKIATLLITCGVGLYFLLPDDVQLIEDLLRDGKTQEAKRQLQKATPADRQRAPERFRRLELGIARRELAPDDATAVLSYWRQAVTAWRAGGYAFADFAELASALPLLRDPAAAWSLVAPELDRAPVNQRSKLAGAFVRAALAANQPGLAATIYAQWAVHPGGPAAQALELARRWQLAGDPAKALAALAGQSAPELEARRRELWRALNLNRELLASLRAELDAAPAEVPAAAVEELVTVALQAGQPAEAVPYLQRRLAAHADDLAAWRRLRDLLIAAGTAPAAVEAAARAVALSGRAADDLRAQGKILEWSGAPAAAFDTWLALAATGDLPAVERLLALNPGLYRDADLGQALARVVPVPGRPEFTLQLARLEVAQGRYPEALAHFQRYLADQGDSADTLMEVAKIQVELNHFAEAETLLRRAELLRPADPAIQRELAAVFVWLGRNNEALARYAKLAAESPTEEVLDPYTRLAETLGRYDELARGIRRRIAQAARPEPRDYLMLAYAFELGADPAARRAALQEGLRLLPANDELRLQLASALAEERKYAEAQAVLAAHNRLHEEPIAAALYLELMRLNNDTAAERRFLAVPLAGALALDENVRERCAAAYEAARDFPAAERFRRELLAERPDDPSRVADLARVLLLRGRTKEAAILLEPLLRRPTPDTLRIAAEVALAAGKLRDAEKYQLAYLQAVRTAASSEWSALGDIRLSSGNRSGARSAYAEALHRLQAQVARKEPAP